jgi:hypothetical protein
MKYRIARTALALVFAAGLLGSVTTSARASDECSLARSAGKWSFTDNGTVIGIGPRTAVGVFTLDGEGNLLDGAATSSLNGSVANETFSGTYVVNSNCTGTANVQIFESGTEILVLTMNLSFDSDMREMRAIFSSLTESNGTPLASVINLEARKQ